jgi:uncharacterized protein (TIGR00730 family)
MNQSRPYIAVFGGSRLVEGSDEYQQAFKLGILLADAGFDLVNGGGQGLMEASAKGIIRGGGAVLGATIKGDNWSPPNEYTANVVESEDLIMRIRHMYEVASGFVVLKGGTGTLAELAITWNLLSLQNEPSKPLILLGHQWGDLLEELRDHLLIIECEEKAIRVADSPEEAVSFLKQDIS